MDLDGGGRRRSFWTQAVRRLSVSARRESTLAAVRAGPQGVNGEGQLPLS